jgi:hypothetical protein
MDPIVEEGRRFTDRMFESATGSTPEQFVENTTNEWLDRVTASRESAALDRQAAQQESQAAAALAVEEERKRSSRASTILTGGRGLLAGGAPSAKSALT